MKYLDYNTMCFSQPTSDVERRAMILGQLMDLYLLPRYVSAKPSFKSWSDERVVTVAGTGWYWQPLATNLHSGGPKPSGRFCLDMR